MKTSSKYKKSIFFTETGIPYKLIYTPIKQQPMRIIVFASGSGGNLKAAIDLANDNPSLIQVGLLVTDRLGINAIDIAQEYGIPVIASDFEKECGIWAECGKNSRKIKVYKLAANRFHNRILQQIMALEKEFKQPFDLAVLSYRRWIHGALLKYFNERMINQHAGDLSVMRKDNPTYRQYIGINPVLYALRAGETMTRTSTFVVRDGDDNGEILCQGPWAYAGGSVTVESAREHELFQKKVSDWPSLRFALREIAQGHFGLALDKFHHDGCKVVIYKGQPLSYAGIDLSKLPETEG